MQEKVTHIYVPWCVCVCVPMKGEENYQILPEFWARLHLPTKYLDKLTNSSDKHFQLKVHLGNSFIFSPRNVLFFHNFL